MTLARKWNRWLICAFLALMGATLHAQDFAPNAGAATTDTRSSVYQTLSTGNVYIDPALKANPKLAGKLDERALTQAAVGARDNPHTYAKIALLSRLPSEFLSSVPRQAQGHERDFYAYKLHGALGMDKNLLVLVVAGGTSSGVSVWTTGLDAQARKRLTSEYAKNVFADPTAGTVSLTQAAIGEINGKEYRGASMLWIFFFLVAGGIVFALVSATRRKKVQLASMRQPIDALRANVLSGIEYLDGYTDVLPKNNPDSDATRMARQAASEKYAQATKILDRATEMTDLQRAQGLLDRAQTDVQTARRALDRATGGTGNIPGDDAMRPEPLPQSETEVQAIPEKERGVSFFSSQPAPIGSLVPVTITVNGQSKQVLATPEEADELRQGRMPQVRSFNVNGRQTPWYDYDRYDPYNDYWRYQNNGWNGNGFLAGWLAADLINDFSRPAFYGSPYAYATDNSYYQGYADAQNNDQMSGFDTAGGGNFFGNDASNNDLSGFDSAGGGDFFGGNDFGGATDSSSDFGGFDAGGGDFSGGDFGGGGDGGGGGGD